MACTTHVTVPAILKIALYAGQPSAAVGPLLLPQLFDKAATASFPCLFVSWAHVVPGMLSGILRVLVPEMNRQRSRFVKEFCRHAQSQISAALTCMRGTHKRLFGPHQQSVAA